MSCGLLDEMGGSPMIEGMGDVGMSKPMRGDRSGDPGLFGGGMDYPVDGGLIEEAALL